MTATERPDDPGERDTFDSVVLDHGPRLKRALVATYGPTAAEDIYADVVSWAWENRGRLGSLRNPGGYLFRVGQSASRRYLKGPAPAWQESTPSPAGVDLDLLDALETLSSHQRAAVVLVLGYGWTLTAAAEQLGCSVSTLRNHVRRGRRKLERSLRDDTH